MAVVPQSAVQLADQDAPVSVSHLKNVGKEPQVELVKSGDNVMAIVVTCRCGQKITLNCHYGSNPVPGEVQ